MEEADPNQCTSLLEAAKEGRLDECRRLVELRRSDLKMRDVCKLQSIDHGVRSTLGLMPQKKLFGVVYVLFQEDGCSPLYLAVIHGHLDVVRFLIEECKRKANAEDENSVCI
jgi:hypothetical protein